MIAVIRIAGMVGINKDVEETFKRLRLRKKHSCTILPNPTKEQEGMIKKIRGFVAYGNIDEKTFEKVIEKRGKVLDKSKKIDAKKAVEELKKGKTYREVNLKPFFRLHPARGGMNAKNHFPRGVLGNHKEKINELIGRML